MIKMGRTLEQILETEKPAVKAQAEAQAKAMLLNIQLAKIRALAQKTQAEMAETLDVKQPTVAGIERVGQDLKLSTLKRYVEAAGGKVKRGRRYKLKVKHYINENGTGLNGLATREPLDTRHTLTPDQKGEMQPGKRKRGGRA